MELRIPTQEQAYWGLRAMKTVAMADGALDDSEVHLLASVQRIFGTTHELEQLASISPADLARAFPDPQLRQQLVQGLIVISLIDGKVSPQEADLVEQFAQALEVSAPEVKDLRHVLNRELLQLRLDLVRRFWLRDKVKEIWKQKGIRGLFAFIRGMIGRYENATLAARYQALKHYPPVRWVVPIGNIVERMGSLSPENKAARWNLFYFTIARTSYPDMERTLKEKCRSPVSAQDSSDAIRGCSSSLFSCSSMSAFG